MSVVSPQNRDLNRPRGHPRIPLDRADRGAAKHQLTDASRLTVGRSIRGVVAEAYACSRTVYGTLHGLVGQAEANRAEPIFGAPDWQMTWGERAAIEGLLSLVRPAVSIAIDTAQGESVRRIAAYSGEVHAVDLLAPPPDLLELSHVHFHAGDSSRWLADLLQRLVEESRNVDFVLVDGDHAGEGVRKDLVTLLESRATADTVIVLHNTMNERVRAGIERAGVEGYPKVAAYELDAVPGYLLKAGKFRGELWGGLGIIKTDARRATDGLPIAGLNHAFPAHAALAALKDDLLASEHHLLEGRVAEFSQSRAELRNQLYALQAERDRRAAGLAELRRTHALLLSSKSWKLTRPLRDVATAVRTRRFAADTARTFVENLHLLNDTLAATDLASRYWVWGGLLIGWAREGRPLAHDSRDADFGILAEDVPRFASAVPALMEAGFAPSLRCITNAGRAMEYQFLRDGAKFEFNVIEPVDGHLRYYEFDPGPPTQALASIADQALVAFEFVGRTWHRHANHDAELTAMYGDWRTPNPDWWYMDDLAIVERTVWTRADEMQWSGDFADLGIQGVI
jgi:Methyltransferase domain